MQAADWKSERGPCNTCQCCVAYQYIGSPLSEYDMQAAPCVEWCVFPSVSALPGLDTGAQGIIAGVIVWVELLLTCDGARQLPTLFETPFA